MINLFFSRNILIRGISVVLGLRYYAKTALDNKSIFPSISDLFFFNSKVNKI